MKTKIIAVAVQFRGLHPQYFCDGSTPNTLILDNGNLSPYEKGKQGVARAIEQVKAEGGKILDTEVTIKVDGTKVCTDFVAEIDGKTTFFEVKNGLKAGFTKNQKIVYPNMLLNRPIVHPVGVKATNIFPYPTNNYNFVIIKFNF